MNNHAVDAMLYAWLAMKEKEVTMDYINLGEVTNISASVPTAIDDVTYHVVMDFVPDVDSPSIFDRLRGDISKVLEHPDSYVLCNIGDIIKAQDEILKLKDRVKELESENADLRNKVKVLEDQKKRLRDTAIYWNNRFTSFMTDLGKILAANGIEFSVKDIDSDGNWNLAIDIPELNEAKKRISELEKGLDAIVKNTKFWHDREKEVEKQLEDLKKENQTLKAKAVINSVYGLTSAELECVKSENGELKKDLKAANKQLDKMDADIDELKNKNRDLEKELDDLKSKKVAELRYEWKPNSFAVICTMCDGSKQSIGMDSSEAIDATSISCGTVPKCSSCAHYKHHPARFTHDWCHIPVSKEGPGYIRKLSKEEAEGPACSDFKARKE